MDPVHVAELLKWPALILGALALVFGAVKAIQHGAAKGAVSKDDLSEAHAFITEQLRIAEVQARPVPTGHDLLAAIQARRERREVKP